ncbi:BnaC03g62560D [Brassica napus]|uniref:BnaC03g62560D protein n=1 Tax=Brassica napus TaxID=3708 RepID=A0A078HY19_BRANA|nr:BnaC03g62560D [Brassica napus]
MDTRFPFSPAEVSKVRVVQFGILSPDEIVILLSLAYCSSVYLKSNRLKTREIQIWSSPNKTKKTKKNLSSSKQQTHSFERKGNTNRGLIPI